MKKISFSFLLTFLLLGMFTACQQNETNKDLILPEETRPPLKEEVVIQKPEPKDITPSAIHFNESINAFEAGKINESIQHLHAGINTLATEGQHLKGESQKRLQKAILTLETAKEELQDGKLKDITKLQEVIGQAQEAVAHEYVMDMNEYMVQVPLPDSYYPHFKATISALQKAEKRLSGKTKIAAQELVKNGLTIIDQMDQNVPVSKDKITKLKTQMNTFLTEHYLQ